MKLETKKSAYKPASHKLSWLLLASMLTGFSGQTLANPTGAYIVNGSVQIHSVADQLNIHNSPGAIINWQDFSIGQQELTRFIQQNSTSAVLNRVVGQNPSAIMGQLLSNGHVFLINPNGVVFGANAVVDTAGLVASSLNLSDEDFKSGNYRFSGNASNGAVINRGLITTGKGGEVVLIAPTVENRGVISVEQGTILLAAGQKMTLSSLDLEGIEFEVQAPANKALNLGKLLANGGSVGVFAGSLINTGVIAANSVKKNKDGQIWLEASSTATVGGKLSAPDITTTGSELVLKGAQLDASGDNGGGQIRIGGDYQGAALGSNVANAKSVTIDAATTITANAIKQGDGGRVIVWSDESTVVNGKISATGGRDSGNGGFVETSGKRNLEFTTPVDVSATNGEAGTWLIDPEDITIDAGKASSIETALNAGSNVDIKTSDTGTGEGNITVASAISKSEGGDATLSLEAQNNIDVNAPLTSTSNKLNVKLTAGKQVNVNNKITTNGGSVNSVITGANVVPATDPTSTDPAAGNTASAATDPTTNTVTSTQTTSAATEITADPTIPTSPTATTETVTAAAMVVASIDSVTTESATQATAAVEIPVEPNTSVSDSIETSGGDISINAGDTGSVKVTGTLDASNLQAGKTGGNIEVLGDQVELAGEAVLDASGDAGGGAIKVGGDYQGQGNTPTATNTTVGKDVTIKADAVTEGDGGRVIVWSDDTTIFEGNISAQGGERSGDGGFAEVSGKKYIVLTGLVDLAATNGRDGTLLLDPGTVNIADDSGANTVPDGGAGSGISTFYNSWINNFLNTNGSLVIRTADVVAALGIPPEDINVNAVIAWNSGNSLTLEAANNNNVNASITNTGTGGLILTAGFTNFINANISMNGGGSTNATGGSGDVVFNSGIAVDIDGDFSATSVTVDSGTATVNGKYTVSGSTSINADSLELNGGGTHDGLFTIANNASLRFTGGIHNLGASASFTGAGLMEVDARGSGGAVVLDASTFDIDINVGDLFIRAGSAAGESAEIRTAGGINGPTNISVVNDLQILAGDGGVARIDHGTGALTMTVGNQLLLDAGDAGTMNDAMIQGSSNQTITASNISLIGGGGGNNNNAYIKANGVASIQNISGTNGLTLTGGAGGDNNGALIQANGNQQIQVGIGGLALNGGNNTVSGVGNSAAIRKNSSPGGTQTITVTGGGNLSVTGGNGIDNNTASILNLGAGTQTLNMIGGNISIKGGSVGTGNTASLENFGSGQTFNMSTGDIDISGGNNGTNNTARISSSTNIDILGATSLTLQDITGLNNNVSSLVVAGLLNATLPTLNMFGGVLDSSGGTLGVNTFNWNGGIQRGAGLTVVNNAISFGGGLVPSILDARTLDITPDVTLGAGNIFMLRNNATLFVDSFTNQGTFDVADATVDITTAFINEATVDVTGTAVFTGNDYTQNIGTTTVSTTGDLTVDNDYLMNAGATDILGSFSVTGNYDQASGATDVFGSLTVDGNYNQLNGATTLNTGSTFDVVGAYTMAAGTTVLNSGTTLNANTYVQTGGTTTFNAGSTLFATAANFNGGSVTGIGTINAANVNVGAATLAPGFSPGTMNILGNLILSSTSTLNFEVGPNSTNYDIIDVSGNINFGGATLNLSWFGGYTPTLGDNYQLFTFGSNPGNTTLGSITAPVTLTSTYNPTNLLLSYGVASTGGGGTVSPGSGLPNPGSGQLPPEVPVIPVFDGNVIQLVVAMWEDAFSQWVNDPLDYNNSFVLLGAINGDNGDRDTGGRGQKFFIPEWDSETGGRGRSGPVCNSPTAI